jgi:serine-type D-Ala-D-Ala carboxypeptidase (penicillin-binding protein 5/6)
VRNEKRKKMGKKLPKKPDLTFLKLASFCLLIIFVTLLLLLVTPQAVNLVDSKFISAQNMPWEKVILAQNGQEDIAGLTATPAPRIIGGNIPAPEFFSGAVLAEDFDTGQILYQKNVSARLAPASTTKLMTALVALDYFQYGDTLQVFPGSMVGGSTMDLHVGERLTFRSLLYGMLLNSGNDAAYTIALNYPGGMPAFLEKMNQKVSEFGLQDCHFVNPAGFDNPNHYCSAADLAEIGRQAALHPQLSTVVATKETYILSLNREKFHPLHNLNQLLEEDGVIGIKTGTTEQAGENFIGLVERNGHKVITVVLNSQDRFGETKKLMDWVYTNYKWE